MPAQCCKDFWKRLLEDTDDPPVFTLAGYDQLAPAIVEAWINKAVLVGVNDDKVNRAKEHLAAIRQFQADHPERCKIPD